MDVFKELKCLQDLKYRDFQAKLIPTIDKKTIIGVRVPHLRKFAKSLDEDTIRKFMSDLPHQHYEENMLHSILISNEKNFDNCIVMLGKFLPFVDNWAVSDAISPPVFKKNKKPLIDKIKFWAKSSDTYTVRVAICLLMKYYLDESFDVENLKIVTAIKSDEYYVKMMMAWFFQEALAKHWVDVVFVLQDNLLDTWTHNKTIQKSTESFKISADEKKYLKSLKRR